MLWADRTHIVGGRLGKRWREAERKLFPLLSKPPLTRLETRLHALRRELLHSDLVHLGHRDRVLGAHHGLLRTAALAVGRAAAVLFLFTLLTLLAFLGPLFELISHRRLHSTLLSTLLALGLLGGRGLLGGCAGALGALVFALLLGGGLLGRLQLVQVLLGRQLLARGRLRLRLGLGLGHLLLGHLLLLLLLRLDERREPLTQCNHPWMVGA